MTNNIRRAPTQHSRPPLLQTSRPSRWVVLLTPECSLTRSSLRVLRVCGPRHQHARPFIACRDASLRRRSLRLLGVRRPFRRPLPAPTAQQDWRLQRSLHRPPIPTEIFLSLGSDPPACLWMPTESWRVGIGLWPTSWIASFSKSARSSSDGADFSATRWVSWLELQEHPNLQCFDFRSLSCGKAWAMLLVTRDSH